MADLDLKLTFESFVVGPANRLASAAARRAADSPGRSYNPLFIYSASGLGKTHILAAVANEATRANGHSKVLYQAAESYLEELAEALRSGRQDSLREHYRSLDFLLLDDVQFLAGQPQAQEMLLSTLDTLTASGRQIILASDRPPSEINGLDARLLSRFSGGLIVDIAAPEYETRVAIIRRKAEEQGQMLQPGVAEALARYPFRSVRELGGALNRVLVVQDLEERPVTAGEVAALMGEEPKTRTGDDFGTFVEEIAGDLASRVETQEEPWRQTIREALAAAKSEGFVARRLQGLLGHTEQPADWQATLARFRADLQRLRDIDEELDRLGNPWPEAAEALVRDPDLIVEAEALLASVRERQRPFPVVGPGPTLRELEGNVAQLALRAAEQLVREDRPRYNPLFIWCQPPDTGKALLGAAARTQRELAPDARAAVTSVAELAEDFIRALSAGVVGAWRERWWTVDLLLVHGVEAFAETERVQDEFFHLFEALKRRGSRILLVSDRPPTAIEGIDERLRSRFEGGLVLPVSGQGLPEGAADLTLHEAPQADGADWESADVAREEAPPAPAPTISTPAARAGTPKSGWFPSPENVVWNWPRLDDRLIEED
jgi:chromosomal replication initiation ATPase DnaA